MRWTTISGVVALFPVLIAGDYLIKSWPGIEFAHDNIKEVYPAAIAIAWFLVMLVLVGFGLFLYTRWTLIEERRKEQVRMVTTERAKLKEKFDKETAVITKELENRKTSLDVRERKMADDVNLVLAAAAAKAKEYNDLLNANHGIAETLTYQLGQVTCALEAISEDHESVLKMHNYLGQWLTKASSSPTEFVACVTNSDFDCKRFERCSGKLEKIQARRDEIRQAMQEIDTQQRVIR